MKPKHDWEILVITSGLLAILILVGGFFMLYRLNQGTLFGEPPVADDSEIMSQKKLVQYMNDQFRKKALDYVLFQEQKPVAVDPSI